MTDEPRFDVFLAHSSKDKPAIRTIYRQLRARGLSPWLDEEEIAPGTTFQDEIQEAIGKIKTAAICIGGGGLGKWQALELKSFISQCVRRDIPIIPVLLPGVDTIPESLIFLQEFHAVKFEDALDEERAFFRLEWGITGKKPTSTRAKTTPEESQVSVSIPEQVVETEPKQEDELASEKGIDYARLRDLLKAQNFKDADYETYIRMLEAVGKGEGDFLRTKEALNFPCTDLKTIDRLWVRYSKGRFGFSVQKEIYVQCGAKLDGEYPGDKIWNEFGDRVGWRMSSSWLIYSQLTFTLEAPEGHLPVVGFGFSGMGRLCLSLLSHRDL